MSLANGGGVAIYVISRTSYNRRYSNDPLLEVVAVQIDQTHARSCVLICWYKPSIQGNDKDSFAALKKLPFAVDAAGKESILIGDTSCSLKDHRNGCTESIKSIYSEFQFEQQIEEHTKVITAEIDGAPHASRILIDHIATNRLNDILRANLLKLGTVEY